MQAEIILFLGGLGLFIYSLALIVRLAKQSSKGNE
ncbi:hypothetical protein X956_00495 [Trueperella pyogenes TP8]|nr:hypothetical protein X956_00495 [Trueperella pyogenes TP8]